MNIGFFSLVNREENRFLVTSLWNNEKSHQEYVNTILPSLKDRAETEKDIISITGRIVKLEKGWEVY